MATIGNASSSSSNSTAAAADTKISNDLVILKERMDLLESMLNPPDAASPKLSVLTNDALRSVIGYLDACGPRMIELVTALCTNQAVVLSEEVFGDVLACNDRLQKLLLDVDTRALTETPASTTVASAAAGAGTASDGSAGVALDVDALDADATAAATAAASEQIISEQFGDLLLGNEDPFAQAHASGGTGGVVVAGAKTTGETSDDFDAAPTAAAAKVDDDDPFDDFFAERTTPS